MHVARSPAHPASNVIFAIVCLAAGLLALGFAREKQRFAAGAAAAGVAGALYWSTGGSFDASAFGMDRVGVMAAVALIGGAGSPLATVLGASLLALLAKIAAPLTDQPLIVDGIALILALIYLPNGVWPPLVAAVRSLSRPRESLTDGAA